MSYTLVYAQFVDERASQREINVVSVLVDGNYRSKFFYDT
jgi:hypothetical protein